MKCLRAVQVVEIDMMYVASPFIVGIALNIDTPKHSIVHEPLIQSTVDLVAANDTDGHGIIKFDAAGTQYLPFRIDIPRSGELPPTLINKLDTHYIDWKYEIHATLQRDHIFSTTKVIKHDLILRRSLDPREENTQALITASTDMPKQFKSKLSAPSRIGLGQDQLVATVEMKARHKSFMIKEIDCAVVQTEDINYFTRRGHPSVENAYVLFSRSCMHTFFCPPLTLFLFQRQHYF